MEASSSGSEEVRRLRARNVDLEQQLAQLRQQQVADNTDDHFLLFIDAQTFLSILKFKSFITQMKV